MEEEEEQHSTRVAFFSRLRRYYGSLSTMMQEVRRGKAPRRGGRPPRRSALHALARRRGRDAHVTSRPSRSSTHCTHTKHTL